MQGWRRRVPWLLGLWLALALLFLVLAAFAAFYDRFPADERIAHTMQDIDVPAFGGFVDFVNWLGGWPCIALAVTLAVVFALVRSGWEALLTVLTLAPRGLNSLVKGWIERPRPSPDFIDVSERAEGFGFPSGHTVGTTVLFGALFFLLPTLVPWRPLRWALQAGCLLIVVAAGPARVYVGAHWPSDVLAGHLLALLVLVPLLAGYRAVTGRFGRSAASGR